MHRDRALIAALVQDSVRYSTRGGRLDAVSTAGFLRSLTAIETKLYNEMFPRLKARTLIPVSHSIPPGAEHHAIQGYTFAGDAKVVSDFAKDFPTVEIKAGERIVSIVSIGASYAYSVQDMRASAMMGRPLDSIRASFARERMEMKLEEIAATGIDGTSLVGALNDGNVAIVAPGSPGITLNGSWNTLVFSSDGLNSGKILADMHAMLNFVFTSTKTIFGDLNGGQEPNRIVLDTVSYAQVASQQMSQYNSKTILEQFRAQRPGVDVESWIKCNTADGSGGPRAWVYTADPNYIALQIPQEFEQFPPVAEGMAWKVPLHMRTAGVEHLRPGSELYVDGLHS
jgi:hypothetical protein